MRPPLATTKMCSLTTAVVSFGILVCCWMVPLVVAQENSDWKVMRIDIPVDEVPQLTTQDYEAISIDELAAELQDEAQRRRRIALNATVLDEAIYVAKLEQGTLSSEQSRWVFSGDAPSSSYRIRELSLALERTPNNSKPRRQLVDHLALTTDGTLELSLDGGQQEQWFGFSMMADPATGPTFDVQLPVATSARMLISTSLMNELQSDQVVVERVASPSEYLPSDWPETANSAGDSTLQWWLVHLSGAANFQLSVRDQMASVAGWYQHTLRSSIHQYVAREFDPESMQTVLDVTSTFDFVDNPTISGFRLRTSKRLRVSSILINGATATWRLLPSQDADFDLLEVQGFSNEQGVSEVRVTASGEHQQDAALPDMAVSDAFAIQGTIRLFAQPNVLVDTVRSQHAVVRTASQLDALTMDDNRLRKR